MKIWKTKVLDKTSTETPGTILSVSKDGIEVSTNDNVLLIKEIQMSGKKNASIRIYKRK